VGGGGGGWGGGWGGLGGSKQQGGLKISNEEKGSPCGLYSEKRSGCILGAGMH